MVGTVAIEGRGFNSSCSGYRQFFLEGKLKIAETEKWPLALLPGFLMGKQVTDYSWPRFRFQVA